MQLQSYQYLKEFQCTGERCEDTCCKGWGMQMDTVRYALYQKEAPELLDAVTTGEAEHIMRRDPVTDYCIKFEGGLCGVHKTRGTKFLGDACHFYPRVTRQFGDNYSQTATLSCPEIARLTLYGDTPFAAAELETDRVPVTIKNYLPEGLDVSDAQQIMRTFIDACDDTTVSAERVLMRLVSAVFSLNYLPQKDWVGAIPFLLRTSETRLPEAEIDFHDGYRLVQILEALIGASKPTARPRLDLARQAILQRLNIHIASNTYEVLSQSGDFTTYEKCWQEWQNKRAAMNPILKRWLQAQLAMASFPFAGFGNNMLERITILAVRFATLRLALMCVPSLEEPEVLRIVQSLARFMDHLADPQFSMLAYTEVGWNSLSRLRGLVMDA